MTPQALLRHIDTGEPWPSGGGVGLTDLPAAYRAAQAVRALRMGRGEVWTARFDSALPALEVGFV